jgi:hypothetical protein
VQARFLHQSALASPSCQATATGMVAGSICLLSLAHELVRFREGLTPTVAQSQKGFLVWRLQRPWLAR